jgi:hypothetical protein
MLTEALPYYQVYVLLDRVKFESKPVIWPKKEALGLAIV